MIPSCNDGAGGDGGDEESYGCVGDHSVIPLAVVFLCRILLWSGIADLVFKVCA